MTTDRCAEGIDTLSLLGRPFRALHPRILVGGRDVDAQPRRQRNCRSAERSMAAVSGLGAYRENEPWPST